MKFKEEKSLNIAHEKTLNKLAEKFSDANESLFSADDPEEKDKNRNDIAPDKVEPEFVNSENFNKRRMSSSATKPISIKIGYTGKNREIRCSKELEIKGTSLLNAKESHKKTSSDRGKKKPDRIKVIREYKIPKKEPSPKLEEVSAAPKPEEGQAQRSEQQLGEQENRTKKERGISLSRTEAWVNAVQDRLELIVDYVYTFTL